MPTKAKKPFAATKTRKPVHSSRRDARLHFDRVETILTVELAKTKDPAKENELEQELLVNGTAALFHVLMYIGDGLHAIARATGD